MSKNGNGDHMEDVSEGDRPTPVDTTRREETDELPRQQRFLAMPPHIALANLDEKIEVLTNVVKDQADDAKLALESFRSGRMTADRNIYTAIRELRDSIKEKIATELKPVGHMLDSAIDSSEKVRMELAEFKVEILKVLAGVATDGAVERAEAERDALRDELEREKEIAKDATARASALAAASENLLAKEREAALEAARLKIMEKRARVALYARIAAGVIVVTVAAIEILKGILK